ncbi:MAG TPA: hypothetical protein VFP93_01105, partial [Gammaproteobacteria bacterium]|nr:hypothetical protein [Gammaproteobacteria bacterium]
MVTEVPPAEGKKTSHPTSAKRPVKTGHPRESSGLEMVLLRNNFYRDNFRRLMVACLLMITAIIVLAGIIIFLIYTRPS